MKLGKLNKVFKIANIIEIIPVTLIILFILYTKSMVQFSYTVLGKLFAVFLIIGYTTYDALYGLSMCLMVILYYQLDYAESTNYAESMQSLDLQYPIKPINRNFILNENSHTTPNDMLSHSNTVDVLNQTENTAIEGMATYYEFQQKHCRNNQLYFKEYKVRNDMVEHVFPEIKFETNICNPCDPNCKISFVNKKIDTETLLVMPKSSNDFFYDSWKDIFGKDTLFFPKLSDFSQNMKLFT